MHVIASSMLISCIFAQKSPLQLCPPRCPPKLLPVVAALLLVPALCSSHFLESVLQHSNRTSSGACIVVGRSPLAALISTDVLPKDEQWCLHQSPINAWALQVREREGVDAADGIDTLLVYLLAELEDAPRLATFADGQQQVTPEVVAGLLQRKGQSDTLAQLYAGAGQAAAGLALWKVTISSLSCLPIYLYILAAWLHISSLLCLAALYVPAIWPCK